MRVRPVSARVLLGVVVPGVAGFGMGFLFSVSPVRRLAKLTFDILR